jgi:hypothetical protein
LARTLLVVKIVDDDDLNIEEIRLLAYDLLRFVESGYGGFVKAVEVGDGEYAVILKGREMIRRMEEIGLIKERRVSSSDDPVPV